MSVRSVTLLMKLTNMHCCSGTSALSATEEKLASVPQMAATVYTSTSTDLFLLPSFRLFFSGHFREVQTFP